MNTKRVTGRGWAYLGAILGGAVSIAANVAHSYVPPTAAEGEPPIPADWTPEPGAVVGAIFWPVALFVAVEILARVAWPDGRRWSLLRFGGLVPVATVAAIVSYKHLAGLLAFYGEDSLTVAIGPLAVDGLMVMATGALLATGARRATVTVAESAPAAVTVAADPTPLAAPAVPAAPVTVDPTPAPVKVRPKVTRRPPSADKVAKAAAKLPGAKVAAIAAKAGVSESTARRYLPADRPTTDATVTPANPPLPAATPVLANAA